MEELKKIYHFPVSNIVLGQAGVYCGLEDVWLELASGYFTLDLIPNQLVRNGTTSTTCPQIQLVLSGSNSQTNSGISVKVKLEGLKLAGDKGKGVPKLHFETISVTLVLRASITINFNVVTQKWESSAKMFQLEILSFKGPYGISKRYR